MEAQLVAIAGIYRTAEVALPADIAGKPAQISLDGKKIVMSADRLSASHTEQLKQEKDIAMAKIVVVTSGKGGVGKTTTSASFASGLALAGKKTAVIDFDVGLRNLDLIMGCERRVVYDLINVIQGEANLSQALIKDKQCDNLFVLAASQTRDKDALTQEGVEKILKDLAEQGFDYIVCDSPAGIETGALMAMHFADEALIVTNPEVSSVRDSDRILGMLGSKTKRAKEGGEPIKEHLLITRYNPNRVAGGQMLSLEDIQDILRIKLIGVIPESESVLQASNQGVPAIHDKDTDVAAGLQRRGGALPRAKTSRCASSTPRSPASSSASSAGGKPCPSSPSCSAKRRRRRASPRSGCRSSWRTSAAASAASAPDYLPELQRELIAVISKYVSIKAEDIKVHLEKQDDLEVLEVKIELPDAAAAALARAEPASAAQGSRDERGHFLQHRGLLEDAPVAQAFGRDQPRAGDRIAVGHAVREAVDAVLAIVHHQGRLRMRGPTAAGSSSGIRMPSRASTSRCIAARVRLAEAEHVREVARELVRRRRRRQQHQSLRAGRPRPAA